MLGSFLFEKFLLHIPCWLHFYSRSFSYTSRAGFIFFWGVSITHPVLALFLFFIKGVSLTHPVLVSFLFGEFLLHIPCWFHFYLGSFSYTSRAASFFKYFLYIFISGVSLTHPVLVLINFLGVSLSHPQLASFLCREFLLHIPC